MCGEGTYWFTSGAVYKGEWKQGKMWGKGHLTNKDGTSYVGDFEDNFFHGNGCYIDGDR